MNCSRIFIYRNGARYIEIVNPYGFIYITINVVNGKKYIGQKKFRNGWKTYLGSGVAFKNAIKKYGRENFHREIIAIAYSKEELNNLEIEFIKLHNAVKSDNYYNIAIGGGVVGLSGKNHPNYGKHYSNELKKKLSESHRTRTVSEERKQYLREVNKGTGNPFYNKHHSEKTKKKWSEERKGKNTGGDSPQAHKVICLTTGKIFDCIKYGAEYYNLKSGGSIGQCCKGKIKSSGKLSDGTKLTWMYYEDYLNLSKIA